MKWLISTASVLCATSAMADYSLTILHTNDFHSRFEPISKYDSGCSAEDNAAGECFGGSARLLSAINDARARSNNAVLIDGGDQFQGTLFYTHYKGKMAAEWMNMVGYDMMTVGNHEFDDGPEVLAGFMDAVEFPVLSSNVDASREASLKDKLKGSAILEQGGVKLGFIGVTPEDTDELASPGPNISMLEVIPSVEAEVKKLEAEGINIIIALTHQGYKSDLLLAEKVKGIDVIVGGHTNTYLSNLAQDAAIQEIKGPYPTMVGNVAVVSAYAYGKFLGELNVSFDDEGNLLEAAGEPLIMDGNVVEDEKTKGWVAKKAEPLEEIRNRVVANTAEAIDGERENCRMGECQMGNLVADAMLARVKDQGIDVALQNGGGLRASIDAGEVTMGEVLTVLPFQNTLSTFSVSGKVLLEALENGVSQADPEDPAGRFLQVAGMSFVWDPTAEAGSRIVEVKINGEALDAAREYGVVSNNYVRNGGDGFAMFKDAKDAYDFGPDLADVTAEFMAAAGAYTPYLDGRISTK